MANANEWPVAWPVGHTNLILNEIPERSREMRYFAILALYGCTELRDYIKGVVDACNI